MQAIEAFPGTDNETNLRFNADQSLRHLLSLKGRDKTLLDDAERFLTTPGAGVLNADVKMERP